MLADNLIIGSLLYFTSLAGPGPVIPSAGWPARVLVLPTFGSFMGFAARNYMVVFGDENFSIVGSVGS